MMAAAGHHSYTLKDNHIADLGTRQYIREMVIHICIYNIMIKKNLTCARFDNDRINIRILI